MTEKDMSPFERIIGAAARHTDHGVYSLPAPARHGQVNRLVDACYPDEKHANLSCVQGFVTNWARFVTRTEAFDLVVEEMRLAPRNQQHYPALENFGTDADPRPNNRGRELYSEDLW
jgi:hypothetical protein